MADTFASRCLQGPVSVPEPGTQARPQVGTKVAFASHPHSIYWRQRHPDPLSISSSCLHAIVFTYLFLPPHPGFLVVEHTLTRSQEGVGLGLGVPQRAGGFGAVVTKMGQEGYLCVCGAPAKPPDVGHPGLMKTHVPVWEIGPRRWEK